MSTPEIFCTKQKDKVCFSSKKEALEYAKNLEAKKGRLRDSRDGTRFTNKVPNISYRCSYCRGYHLTSANKRRHARKMSGARKLSLVEYPDRFMKTAERILSRKNRAKQTSRR